MDPRDSLSLALVTERTRSESAVRKPSLARGCKVWAGGVEGGGAPGWWGVVRHSEEVGGEDTVGDGDHLELLGARGWHRGVSER